MATGIGVDVAKDKLDVGCATGQHRLTFNNTPCGREQLVHWLQQRGSQDLHVIVEPSGGYEVPVLFAVYDAGIRVTRVHANRVRQAAQAMGFQAKTDTIDAQVLALMASLPYLKDAPWSPPKAEVTQLRALVSHQDHLIQTEGDIKRRLKQAQLPSVQDMLSDWLRDIKARLKAVEKAIQECIAEDDTFQQIDEVLQTTQGVGPKTSAVMMAFMPELGRLDRSKAAALVGIAPMNNQTGSTKRGEKPRLTHGGRGRVRRALYCAVISAIRHNDVIRAHYKKLKARGRPTKVAIIACARKLLIHLNARLRSHYDAAAMAV